MIFLGCDGGSTKTALVLADETGHVRARFTGPGCNYAFLGDAGFARHMAGCLSALLDAAGLRPADVTRAMFGLPVYGEVPGTEERIPAILRELLPGVPLRIANDAVVGWGGALAGQPGISVVAGTGSIAYGCDPSGQACRVGGWSLLFADEGSCSWIGRQVITAFVQQADGRLPRTPLYDIVRAHIGLDAHDLYFTQQLQIEYRQDSSKLAGLQLLALQAAQAGDTTMEAVYTRAADELVRMALTICRRLDFPQGAPVSYSGGLFRAGDRVLAPFRQAVEQAGCTLVQPLYSPTAGAAALAARDCLPPDALTAMLRALHTQGV